MIRFSICSILFGDQKLNLRTRRSYCIQESPKHPNTCRSDLNIMSNRTNVNNCSGQDSNREGSVLNKTYGEYYKRYEHDEIPVKDYNDRSMGGEDKKSITNSDLDKLEMKVFNDAPNNLHDKDNSVSSLESNIKFFKTTVQEIFDNFNKSMRDYEQYKNRFQEILAKSQEDSLVEMEEFIKDMIQHIMSSDTSVASTQDVESLQVKHKETDMSYVSDSFGTLSTNERVVEAYKNENYLTDSTTDDAKAKLINTEEIFNIFLLGGTRCLQIKMNERNLLSEINIKDEERFENHVASAENIKKLAAKRLEVEKYLKKQLDSQIPDREIPVKSSFAKNNIHLNEDFVKNECNDSRSFISKFCSFLCKKFRKNSFN